MVSLTVQFFNLVNNRVFPSVQCVIGQELFPSSGAVWMLDVTRNTICRARTETSIAIPGCLHGRVTCGARLSRRRAVDRVKAVMTARTCDKPSRISLYALRSLEPGNVYRVKIPAEPRLIVFVAGRGTIDLGYGVGVLFKDTFPFPDAVDHRITIRA